MALLTPGGRVGVRQRAAIGTDPLLPAGGIATLLHGSITRLGAIQKVEQDRRLTLGGVPGPGQQGKSSGTRDLLEMGKCLSSFW